MAPSLIAPKSSILFIPCFVCFFVLTAASSGWAQESSSLSLQAGYWGNNLWNPGVKLGVQYLHRAKSKANRRGEDVLVEQFFNGSIGVYVDPGSHTGLISQLGVHFRKGHPGKMYYSWGLSPIGVFRSFLPETYEVGANGQINQVTLPGRFYYAPGAHFEMGKPLKNRPWIGWFGGVDLSGLVPYNTYAMLLVNVQLGCRFQLNATGQ